MMDVPLYYLFLCPDKTIDLHNFTEAVQKRLTELQWTPEQLFRKAGVIVFHAGMRTYCEVSIKRTHCCAKQGHTYGYVQPFYLFIK